MQTLPTPARTTARPTAEIDADALAADLTRSVRGEVRFDAAGRGLYATDASSYRQVPIGVVVPRDRDDVVAAVRVAREHGAPILCRGGGTSLAGQCCNAAVVLDFSRHLNRVLEVDVDGRWARVEPGVVLDRLRERTTPHGLTFGPDPSTHASCTLGGMIGNNACGVHSIQARFFGPGPRTEHQVLEMTVLTYDGEVLTVGPTSDQELARRIEVGDRTGQIFSDLRALRDRYAGLIRDRFPDIPRRVSGYNLPSLLPEGGFDVARALVGSESTCAVILEAKVALIPDPPERALLVLGYADAYEAGDHVPAILAHRPLGLEGMDYRLVDFMKLKRLHLEHLVHLPDGNGWLLVEFGGDTAGEAEATARAALADLRANGSPVRDARVYTDPVVQKAAWLVRESGLGATAFVPGHPPAWEGWEDAAVAPEHIGRYLRDFRALLDRYDYDSALYGHFGDGCVHCRIDFDYSTREGVARYRAFIEEAADLVLTYGGSLSGEHGDGQSRAALLERMYGPELVQAFREFKRIWDPDGRMNPGKVVDPYDPGENLAYGPDYSPRQVETTFTFPATNRSFHDAARLCVGVGKCRRTDTGTMCPSYMATGEEMHSTRGRARLLQEMMRGEVVADGWRSDEVREALDLCLSCKACRTECPMNVDMATYKAEFMAHYYRRRLRPRSAYFMGLIYWWARLASHAPRIVNAAAAAPGISSLVRRLAGVSTRRRLPRFATRAFRALVRDRPSATAADAETGRVILWPDTFNNFFHPEVGLAAVRVLEAAGFRPVLPDAMLCCGRPLYEFGMLRLARRQLRQVLDGLRDDIRAGTPVVGLEPSCVSVFRGELVELFPDDPDARRLADQTWLLAEFLEERAPDAALGDLSGTAAVLHGHCHQKSVLGGTAAERALLERLGADCRVLDSGCCGMAGPFGFHDGRHYDVAQACGERALLPAAREADSAGGGEVLVTSGFSCSEMVEQNGLPRPLHLAELLDRALLARH